nr:hypothetical protein [Tanacetum cinerariifolium]
MVTKEIIDRFMAPCFVNGLEAYDGEINLRVEENMISNEFVVKLCLEHKVKHGNKVVKKELIVALRGEIYFVKFIINPEEDDVEQSVVFGRSFLRLTKATADFENETITIYLELDPFLLIYFDMGPSMSTETPLTQEEAEREVLPISICERYSLLEEERLVIETMTYSDKYKKILDGICLEKRKLDGMNKEEEEAIIKIKGEALIEKDDPRAFVILIRIEDKINLNALVDTGSDINVIPYRIYKELGKEEVQNVKKGISMLNHSKTMRGNDDEAGSSRTKRSRQYETVEEVLLPQVHHEFLEWEGCNRDMKTRMRCGEEIDGMLRINLCEAGTKEEIFTFMAWIRAFNINEPIYSELCHEFYSNYEFDEVCADDELKNKKINKFRLGGRAHSLTLLEFARRWDCIMLRSLMKKVLMSIFKEEPSFEGVTYDDHLWLCLRTNGEKEQVLRERESLIFCKQFITKLARKARVLSDEVLRSLSALTTSTLRELIDSEGRPIPEDPQPDVPRVTILRAQ